MGHGFSRRAVRRTSLPAPPGPLGYMAALALMGLLAGCGGGGEDPAAPDGNQVTCPPGWGTGAFFRAATPAQVAACVEAGESVRRRSPDTGETPLHLAGSYSDDPAVIRALIEAGASPGARDNNDHTVLCVAVVHNENPAVIQALLDGGSRADEECRHGADPNGIYPPGVTPLHLAAWHNGNPDVAEVLIRAGADLEAEPGLGGTPLCFAAWYQDAPAMVELLIRSGAETGGAVACAARNQRSEILRTLIAAEASLSWGLHISVFNDNTTITEILIEAGADLDEQVVLVVIRGEPIEGATPLHFAAALGRGVNLEAVEALLQAGADPNIQDATGRTPLDWAESGGQTQIAALLRQHGGRLSG